MGDTTRRVFLVVAALTTIGCDQATNYAASRLLVHAPDHSCVADVIRVGYAENTGRFLSLGADQPKPSRTEVFTAATGVTPTWIASGAIQCDGAQARDAAGTATSPDSRHADCKSEDA